MDKYINYLVSIKKNGDKYKIIGPTGITDTVSGSDLEEALSVTQDYPDWPLEGTIVLLFGCWVCEYPDDLSEYGMFSESVDEVSKGKWTLTLSYDSSDKDIL